MTWYAAHLILCIEFLDGIQDHYTVWENIYLIRAETVSEAYAKADDLGRLEEVADETSGHTCDGRPARFRFAGVRRLAECIDFGSGPEDGKEVTYLEYTLRDKEALEARMSKRACPVVLESQGREGSHPELVP